MVLRLPLSLTLPLAPAPTLGLSKPSLDPPLALALATPLVLALTLG